MKVSQVSIYDYWQRRKNGLCYRVVRLQFTTSITLPYLCITPDFNHIRWICQAWGIQWPMAIARKLYVGELVHMVYDDDPIPF